MRIVLVERLAPRAPAPALLAARVGLADGWWSRLRGLIGRPPLQPGQGLWIVPCQQVHTHFMGGAIDVVFLDPAGTVLRILPALRPWRFSPWVRGARAVLELPPGAAAAAGLSVGERLAWREPA